ncbi:hypothetical protein ABER68_09440 [Paenibacillus alvei]
MKQIHETQMDETNYINTVNNDEIFVPYELKETQRATGDRFPVKDYDVSTFPKPVRYAGYLLGSFLAAMLVFILVSFWLQ